MQPASETSLDQASKADSERSLLRDTTGAILTEYVVLLAGVSLGAAAALVKFGPAIVNAFLWTRSSILLPFP
jgi:Flp pilus assembly pilin Flp